MLKQPPYSHSPSKPSPPSPSTLSPSKPSLLSASPSTPPPIARASNIHNTNTSRIQLPNVYPLHSPIIPSPLTNKERLFKIADFPQVLSTTLPHISTLEANHLVDNPEMVSQNPQKTPPSPIINSHSNKHEPFESISLIATTPVHLLEDEQLLSPTSPIVSDGNLHDCLTLSSPHLHFPSFDNFVEELRHNVTNIRNLNKSAINPYIIADQWKNCIVFVNDWMNTNVKCGQKIAEKNMENPQKFLLGIPKISTSTPHIKLPTIITMEEPTMNFTPPIQSKLVQFFATKEDLDSLVQIKQSQAQIQHTLDLLLSKFC